ncbi:MAG TPA: CZB domain-containing protein [Methylophilus sp.]|nr:CZB domain-containing protein [Methylophilus sp.]HQQ32502.1 CZB domain-containing protein [Methylophilus sp.]
MGFIDWFTERGEAFIELLQPNEAVTIQEQEDMSFNGLDLRQELAEHHAWRHHLERMLKGETVSELRQEDILLHQHCSLGQWLDTEGKKHFGHLPEYAAARKAHKHFHACLEEILTLHEHGDDLQAEELLMSKFRSASNKNQLQLITLFTMQPR